MLGLNLKDYSSLRPCHSGMTSFPDLNSRRLTFSTLSLSISTDSLLEVNKKFTCCFDRLFHRSAVRVVLRSYEIKSIALYYLIAIELEKYHEAGCDIFIIE